MSPAETHSAFRIGWFKPWWEMYVSQSTASRLVVFLHGFGGNALSTWAQFDKSGSVGQWWQESDMLFVGYRSTRENITSVADRLRKELPNFYPVPFPPAMTIDGVAAREDVSSPYEELVLVGHSLGGLIIRCALVDAVQQWVNNGKKIASRPILLSAQTRLFSPASAGFRPAGLLGLAEEIGALQVAQLRLGMSSAYRDLQPGSSLIEETRSRTERLFQATSETSLQASILWANPDNVVKAEWYGTDKFRQSTDWGRLHTDVCKPSTDYGLPWHFVEQGDIPT